MEHLFKLKKDGKCVGYLRIKDGKVWWKYTEYEKAVALCWYNVGVGKTIKFDTAHQFVTKGKNGKDVFIDDFVWFHWMGKKSKAQLINDNWFNRLIFCEKKDIRGLPRTFCKSDKRYIELIEDKDGRTNT